MKIYKIKVNGKTYKVELEAMEESKSANAAAPVVKKEEKKAAPAPTSSSTGGHEVLAPIQGMLLKYKVKVGDKVKKGDVLLLIEAMKLENEVCAPCDGVVSELVAPVGNMVSSKQLLVKIK